jgi:hypothetical protein
MTRRRGRSCGSVEEGEARSWSFGDNGITKLELGNEGKSAGRSGRGGGFGIRSPLRPLNVQPLFSEARGPAFGRFRRWLERFGCSDLDGLAADLFEPLEQSGVSLFGAGLVCASAGSRVGHN